MRVPVCPRAHVHTHVTTCGINDSSLAGKMSSKVMHSVNTSLQGEKQPGLVSSHGHLPLCSLNFSNCQLCPYGEWWLLAARNCLDLVI